MLVMKLTLNWQVCASLVKSQPQSFPHRSKLLHPPDFAYITGQQMEDCLYIINSDISDAGMYVKLQKNRDADCDDVLLRRSYAKGKTHHQSIKGLTMFYKRDVPLSPTERFTTSGGRLAIWQRSKIQISPISGVKHLRCKDAKIRLHDSTRSFD